MGKKENSSKKNVGKLQKAVIDGLQDVKAQEILVFDTEALSAMFERVIVASGTSNRQTKALAVSVRDAVRKAGFDKPRMEGEDNGEWIIVDCGPAVVHIMQPAIRQYYRLEELWGEKPVRLKVGAPLPPKTKKQPESEVTEKKTSSKVASKTTPSAAKKTSKSAPSKSAPSKKAPSKKTPSKKVAATKPPTKKVAAKKSAATQTPAKTAVKKPAVKKVAAKAVASVPAN